MDKNCIICKSTDISLIYNKFPGYIEGSFFDIFKCNFCNSHFIMTDSNLNDMYEKIYSSTVIAGYDRYYKYAQKVKDVSDPLKFLAYSESTYYPVFKFLKNKKESNILEIGCGYGYLSYALYKKGFKVTGIDISKRAIDFAKDNFGNFFFKSDVNSINNYVNEKFDLIIATEVIEHLIEPNLFVEECIKLLKNDGTIILTTPNKDYYNKNYIWQTDSPPVHISWLSKKAIDILAKKNKLKVLYTDFSKYYPKYENRLMKYFRSKQKIESIVKLTKLGLPIKNQNKLSKFRRLTSFVLHRVNFIRFFSNLVYNKYSGDEITHGVLLSKLQEINT